MAAGVEVGNATGVANDAAGGTVGTGVSMDVTVGNEASGGGSNVAVAIEPPGSVEGEGAVVVEIAVVVASAATSGGSSVGPGSSVAGTPVADCLISPSGRADSVGPALVPVSVHATTTSNAIATTPIACPRTDGE